MASSSCNWVYDVFPSFSGEDVRATFLSHFLKELEQKLIIVFKDNEIERSQSLDPSLKQAIRTSRIAVVVFSDKYPSSSWCLDELLEIVKCKEESGQLVIPVFYGLDPSHVRKQTGDFGEAFAKTCLRKTEDEAKLWRKSLTDVANLLGYHSQIWHNEAEMIEAIANNILSKLDLTSPKDFEDFVGLKDHIAKMSFLLHLESEQVRMVGIWGSSGIGKTTIARVLYSQLFRRFQGSVFIDKAFVSKSMELYSNANPDDYNKKLHLLKSFMSEMLNQKDISTERLDVLQERLKHHKVLIFIDDLDDQVVLDTLVGQNHWFGNGSRIIVVTKNKHFLRAHGIDHIYEVCLPSREVALEMFCMSAFRRKYPPFGLMELASEVVLRAGNLPLGLKVLGSYLRGREKEDWMDLMPSLCNRLNGKIETTLRVSYDGLSNRTDKEIFRHIACLLNGEKINDIKLMLPYSIFDVNIGLKNLVDMSLIHVREDIVEMHRLVEDMGKEVVRAQSNEPAEREFLTDPKDICSLLEDTNGTKKVLGIALDMDETEELRIHENAFKGMHNLLFLKLYSKKWEQKKEVRWYLPKGFNYLPHKVRLLRLDGYPLRCMPLNLRVENLVKLQMPGSKLTRLWKGVQSLGALKEINLERSTSLKEIPDLSMATNLEILDLSCCSSLVKLPSSIKHLNKLVDLLMAKCTKLESLPTGINLQSLYWLNLYGCTRLETFPNISTNIQWLHLSHTRIKEFPSNLRLEKLFHLIIGRMKSEKFWRRIEPLTPLMTMLPPSLISLCISDIPSLVELPASIQNFTKLDRLVIRDCVNLETLPTRLNFPDLSHLNFSGCSRLRTFPDISTNVKYLYLDGTAIEEVPWWIEKFTRLRHLYMNECNHLKRVSLHISKLKYLDSACFSNCVALTKASWSSNNSDCSQSKSTVIDEANCSSFPDNLINCFNFNLVQKPIVRPREDFRFIKFSGEEVPTYFTHRTTGNSSSLTNIPLLQTSLTPSLFRFKACTVVECIPSSTALISFSYTYDILISCRFKARLGRIFDFTYRPLKFYAENGINIIIFECCIPLNEDKASLPKRNYDHVDIHIHLRNDDNNDDQYYASELKGWGVQLSDNFSLPEIRLGDHNTLSHV